MENVGCLSYGEVKRLAETSLRTGDQNNNFTPPPLIPFFDLRLRNPPWQSATPSVPPLRVMADVFFLLFLLLWRIQRTRRGLSRRHFVMTGLVSTRRRPSMTWEISVVPLKTTRVFRFWYRACVCVGYSFPFFSFSPSTQCCSSRKSFTVTRTRGVEPRTFPSSSRFWESAHGLGRLDAQHQKIPIWKHYILQEEDGSSGVSAFNFPPLIISGNVRPLFPRLFFLVINKFKLFKVRRK